MGSPLILVIDDSPTIRKMVECHLTEAGYRVVLAASPDSGYEAIGRARPDLILLDHQLLGITGEEVCRRLLESEVTAHIPVVISSAMRNRAFARYAEFSNVVDQIPKPFTPELLRSGVSNALQLGALVVQAQRTGSAMPESVAEQSHATLHGATGSLSFRAVLDFLNNQEQTGRLAVEVGKDRIRLALAGGKVRAVFAPGVDPDRIEPYLPADLADLAALLPLTLAERQDASLSGLVKMLEGSLSDPRRLRALLRTQAAVLVYWLLAYETGEFSFEPGAALPPMFQAFPLDTSLPALALEAIRRCGAATIALDQWAPRVFVRANPKGGNLDRSGLSAAEMKVQALLDGTQPLEAVAAKAGLELPYVIEVVRGLELAGLAEPKAVAAHGAILLLEDDPETIKLVQRVLGPEGDGYALKVIRDRVSAQLVLRRHPFRLVLVTLDRPEHEAFCRGLRAQAGSDLYVVGIVRADREEDLTRLDALGLDGVLQRPFGEADLREVARHLLGAGASPVGAHGFAYQPAWAEAGR